MAVVGDLVEDVIVVVVVVAAATGLDAAKACPFGGLRSRVTAFAVVVVVAAVGLAGVEVHGPLGPGMVPGAAEVTAVPFGLRCRLGISAARTYGGASNSRVRGGPSADARTSPDLNDAEVAGRIAAVAAVPLDLRGRPGRSCART